jgi:hypothetical protein
MAFQIRGHHKLLLGFNEGLLSLTAAYGFADAAKTRSPPNLPYPEISETVALPHSRH